MSFNFVETCILLLLLMLPTNRAAEVNLTQTLLILANVTSELSEILFLPRLYPDASNNFDSFQLFTDEPDVSVVASKNGYCYGVARATTANIADQRQNFVGGSRIVCSSTNESNCCTAKKGWTDAYDNSFRSDFEKALRDCAASCTKDDGCVVIGGMSQGAAISAVASIFLADLNPYVILLGQPETLFPDCTAIDPHRHFNFINSGVTGRLRTKIAYDNVYMKDYDDAMHYGHIILLSDDPTGVAYLGLNSKDRFTSTRGFFTANAHTLRRLPGTTILGYSERFDNLLRTYGTDNRLYPVRESGFILGWACTQSIECDSGFCGESGYVLSLATCQYNPTNLTL